MAQIETRYQRYIHEIRKKIDCWLAADSEAWLRLREDGKQISGGGRKSRDKFGL